MKKVLLLLVLAVAVFFVYKKFFKKEVHKEKPVPIAVSKHSAAFSASANNILDAYYTMLDGFVNWDSTTVNKSAYAVVAALDSFQVDDLKKDTSIFETANAVREIAKINTEAIINNSIWADKRSALKDLSENLRTLLVTVKYDGAKVYWQECPMALGEGLPANWLSKTEEVINPYLGKKDPKYGDGMLHCGETKMTINFLQQDSIIK